MATATATTTTPFTWEGTDRTGKKVKGKVVSTSEAAVRSELRRQGVVPTRVRKQSNLFRKQGKVTAADIAIFSRQLATMMSAGIPLVQSFDIVGAGHENPAMQKLILAIKADVDELTVKAPIARRRGRLVTTGRPTACARKSSINNWPVISRRFLASSEGF